MLLTTAIALMVAGAAMLTHDLVESRHNWAADLATEAQILALSTAPALAFDDHDVAVRNLAALQARSAVRAAALYSPTGRLYAQYVRPGEELAPAELGIAPAESTRITGERVEVTHRIIQHGEWLGTIYLRARYDLSNRIRAYLEIFGAVTGLSLLVAAVLSTRLQRVITSPLDSMSGVAHHIVRHRDYSLRASKSANDEMGFVVDAFNTMLGEVQSRTLELEQTNAALRSEAQTRHAAEAALRESEELYRAIGESIEYGVWVSDELGQNTYASASFLKLTGLTQAQFSADGLQALHPDDAKATLAAWRESVRTGGVFYHEYRVRGTDGNYHPILSQGVPIRSASGDIRGWAGINLDVSRLKHTEEALREADRRKDEFLATLAHELRNPLAPIRNAVQLLEMPTVDERRRQWGREIIARQVQRMALLLDDLLDVSRITRGRLELKKDFVDLASLVATAVETARPLIDTKGHTLEISLPTHPVELEVDPLRLSQSLSNLLTNAAKYTDSGGRITLTVALQTEELSLAVKDTGIGLSAAAIPKLFEMFSQVHSAIDRAEGGLGIGLALVKGLVELHGGTVEVTSAGLARGSTFTIHLPRAVVVNQTLRANAQPAATIGPVHQGRRVLIADDNQDAADSLALVLQTSGYTVTVAHSSHEALAAAMRERPDAFVLDIGLPGMTGYELARRIRQQAWGRHALLLAVTGWGQEEDKERAVAGGFDAHLTKPADTKVLLNLLSAFFSEHPTSSGPRAPQSKENDRTA